MSHDINAQDQDNNSYINITAPAFDIRFNDKEVAQMNADLKNTTVLCINLPSKDKYKTEETLETALARRAASYAIDHGIPIRTLYIDLSQNHKLQNESQEIGAIYLYEGDTLITQTRITAQTPDTASISESLGTALFQIISDYKTYNPQSPVRNNPVFNLDIPSI